MKIFLALLITALLAVSATWFTLRPPPSCLAPAAATPVTPLVRQCAMHPQVRSEQPGRCTICGMELTAAAAENLKDPAADTGNRVVLTQNQIQVLQVQTVEATTRPLVRTLHVAGVIVENTLHHRVVSAYAEGRIDKLYVSGIGSELAEGQPLAELLSPTLLQAEQAYRQVGGAQRKKATLQLQQNGIAPELIEQPYIQASVQRLRTLGLSPAQIDALDEKPAGVLTSQILSPISGTVVAQTVYAGQYVETGASLFEIADFSTMWFLFPAYEEDLPWIKIGLNVRINTPTVPEKTFTAKITFINPNFDDTTRSTNVRVELPNPLVNGQRELLNRILAKGTIELTLPSVLTVPRSAVIETGAEAVVYLDQGTGTYERRVLTTGRRGDIDQEVLAGIQQGERVVTHGNLLIDGQAEMNRAVMPPPVTVAVAPPQVTFNDGQQQAIGEFVKMADALAAALGADDLNAFNSASQAAMKTTETMVKQLRPGPGHADTLDALAGTARFHDIKDLQSARVAFHPFTVAATTVLQPLRQAIHAPAFQVYECGMVSQAIPGVPKKARWIQTGGRALRNPFFGKEMPDCGEEIQP